MSFCPLVMAYQLHTDGDKLANGRACGACIMVKTRKLLSSGVTSLGLVGSGRFSKMIEP
jgi:hypothetical protein